MTAKQKELSLEQLKELYDETELAILFDWLQIPRPEALRAVATSPSEDEEPPDGHVRLETDRYGECNDYTLGNAVARLLLSEIQGRLPQWGVVFADGSLVEARAYTPKRRSKVEVLPRFLFEINWADSGPGFSWPEAYHLAYLPGFHRYVVTASQDSTDMYGYTDEAIGHFPADEDVEKGGHDLIVGWWSEQASHDQERWEYLFGTGDVDEATAYEWADEVWPSDDEDEEEEDEDEEEDGEDA